MGIKALEGLTPTWFTPPGQDGDDKPTRFKCRPLDGNEYAEVADYVGFIGGGLKIGAAGQLLCLRYGLADWDGFEDSAGPVEFNMVNIRRIPYSTRTALATHIFVSSNLSEDQEKNSSLPSKSQ